MTIEHLPHSTNALPIVKSEGSECRTVASCKRKLAAYRLTEIRLRGALARNEILLRQKDALIQNHALLSKEFDHRLMNELQVIVACFRCKAAYRRIPRSLLTWLPRPTA